MITPVVVTAPTVTHEEIALELAQARVVTLIEKPLAYDSKAAQTILRRSRATAYSAASATSNGSTRRCSTCVGDWISASSARSSRSSPGGTTNLSRPWHKGNHPGLQLARRLKRKAEQVWLFTTRLDVPATNNGSESAIRRFKLAAKVQGCWRTLTTLQRHCRIRSYLISARNHGRRPIDAIRDALSATPWMPPQTA